MTITQHRIHEIKVPGRPLGRHFYYDDRNANYPAEQAEQLKTTIHPVIPGALPLDQGQIGDCTANAAGGALNTKPNASNPIVRLPLLEANCLDLYKQETADEGYPYPQYDPGGSGTTVCQAAKELGWLTSYTHAVGIQAALAALVKRPILVGLNWYTSFDTPDSNGIIGITAVATVRGGHEIFSNHIDVENELVWFWNSWGRSYGLNGRMAMSFQTLERLLNEEGDVTVPVV